MSMLSDAVWAYFAPCRETFWRWSEDKQAVVWVSGETIAFRVELQALVESMAPQGVLPLENLLLTVAACRNRSGPLLRALPKLLTFSEYSMRYSMVEAVGRLVPQLELLSQLPEDVRTSIDGKRAILELIAENGPIRKKPAFSQDCVDWLAQGFSIQPSPPVTKPTNDWITEIRGLHDGLAAVNEVAVRLRMKTGFDALPVPAPVPLELPPAEPQPLTVAELLHELEQDEEHEGLVRLTRRLLSVASLPRPVSSPDDQPLGGVSDITNRGPFDRLLLSELAQDSDVLMTRVALNEAMYIRREIPPALPPRERLILVDAGIRMWGLPRLYATALALAYAMMQDKRAATRLFRPTSTGVAAIDLTVREELVDHLASLELPVHPGDSLLAFVEQAAGAAADFIIITGEDVLSDLDFRRTLAEQHFPSLYLAAVTREGDLRVMQRSRQGERPLRQAKLDLNAILAQPPRARPAVRDESLAPTLPAICRVRPFPLYLNHQVDWENSGIVYDVDAIDPSIPHSVRVERLLTVAHDQRLTLWNTEGLGPIELTDRLPPGRLVWHATRFDSGRSDNEWHLVVGIAEQGRISSVRVWGTTTEIVPLSLPQLPVKEFVHHNGLFYVLQGNEMRVFAAACPERCLDCLPLPDDKRWLRGRFFTNAQGLHVVAYDGQRTVWNLVKEKKLPYETIKTVFDCSCLGSPVAVHTDNSVELIGSSVQLKFTSSYAAKSSQIVTETQIGRAEAETAKIVARISPDGNRFVLMETSDKSTIRHGWRVDLDRLTAVQTWGDAARILNSTHLKYPPQKSLRNRFAAIAVYNDQLVLISNKGKVVGFDLATSPERIILVDLKVTRQDVERAADFQVVRQLEGIGYELKSAQWSDGSRAWIDSRGLLHVKSSNTQVPEMTFVLYDTNVAGWCDHMSLWGDPSFTGPIASHLRVSPESVLRSWLRNFCKRLK